MHRLRWDDLHYLLAVAEQGSLSGAARALGVNHATVLRRIAALEERHGVVLFDRDPGGYRLRPEGQEMLSALRAIRRTVDRLERAFSTVGKEIEGAFRLTTTDSIAEALLPRHLAALAERHPRLRVELTIANRPIDMARPEAEITLRPALHLPEGLEGRRAADMAFQVFAAPGYLAVHRGRAVEDHAWLGVAPPLTRAPVGAWQDERIAEHVLIRADSFVTLAGLAEAGLGLAMLPSFLGRARAGLVPVAQFPDRVETGVWVASHPDLMRYEHVRRLVDFFAAAFERDAASLTAAPA